MSISRGTTVLRASVILSVCAVAASVIGWWATGREGYTRWPNEKLAAADVPASSAEEDLLADIGFASGATEHEPDIESRFALGLLPGGFDAGHLLSVATVGVLGAITASAATLILGGHRRATAL